MVYGNKKLCNYNEFSLKSPFCDYKPLLNPYDSSSGIDRNPFEIKENFNNIKKRYNHKNNIIFFVLFLIIFIILLVYKK